MFDKEFFKMVSEFVVIVGVGMLLIYTFSGYVGDQTAVPTQAVVK